MLNFLDAHPELHSRPSGPLMRARAAVARDELRYRNGYSAGRFLAHLLRLLRRSLRLGRKPRRGAIRIEPTAADCQLVWPELLQD